MRHNPMAHFSGLPVYFNSHLSEPVMYAGALYVRDQEMCDDVMDDIRWTTVWQMFGGGLPFLREHVSISASSMLREFLSEIFYRRLPWLSDR